MAAELADGMRKVPAGDMAFVADATLTNEEFFRLKALARAAGGGRVFAPVAREVREFRSDLARLGFSGGFPASLEEARQVLILGERLEEEHPVLTLRVRRLHAQGTLKITTAGGEKVGFDDIRSHHVPVGDDPDAIVAFLSSLARGEVGPTAEGPAFVFLTDRWVNGRTYPGLSAWVRAVAPGTRIELLLTGANAAGILDQWDDAVRPVADVETEIQRGKVQGLLWFGKAPATPIFDEYARGMRIFAQAVLRASDAHPRAHFLLPLDTFLEKKGTYANTFGRVGVLRRSTRIVEKGFDPLELIPAVSAALGRPDPADVEKVYEEIARSLAAYPKAFGEISESKETYTHYERATWR
jgi:NADH dehydrogenase/NADH:ubiquinone oxidoreductase subunit G